MSDMKMSEVFDLPVSVDGFNLNDGHLGVEGDTTIANFDYEFASDLSESMAHHAAHAINNHDRLVEENAEFLEVLEKQRESLDAFRELVKTQAQTMIELNEKCKKLEGETSELREALKDLIECKGILTSDKECVIKAKQLLSK